MAARQPTWSDVLEELRARSDALVEISALVKAQLETDSRFRRKSEAVCRDVLKVVQRAMPHLFEEGWE